MAMSALIKLELDIAAAGGCQSPGCKHEDHGTLYLNQRCHPGAGVEVRYDRGTGVLKLQCMACHISICNVKVADQ